MTYTSRESKVESRKESACSAGSSLIPHPSSLALCLALLAPGTVLAQVANDPMRPPSGYATTEVPVAAEAATSGGLMLQSVLISPTEKSAIISGVMVKLGEKYGDAVLVKVAENEVVLRSAGENQVLKLYPGIEKRDVAPAAEKSGAQRKSGAALTR
jgi:hypothetical protein